MDGLWWCAGCRDWLHPRWFLRWKQYATGKEAPARCRACRSYSSHEARIKKEFGIDAVEYERLLDAQGGVCAICLGRPRSARLAVDHDHNNGAIRGLLCSRCNTELLGSAHDSVDILLRAVKYLQEPPAQTTKPMTLEAMNY